MLAYPDFILNKPPRPTDIIITGRLCRRFHAVLSRLTGYHGCFGFFATLRLLNRLKMNESDILQLHNIHSSYINIPLLFRYVKRHNIKVVWTLHDCWSFTGHCAYIERAGCTKWREGCCRCRFYKDYPPSIFDNSKKMYRLKKRWFCGVERMTLVTPSEWLAGLVSQSFLGEYEVKTIQNGIDLKLFKPTDSNFRSKHGLLGKVILLGVSSDWEEKKGIYDYARLAGLLDDRYKIVLVGVGSETEKELPDNILAIRRTESGRELAEIYTAADIFLNLTHEDNFPTVNLEALACGTPVLTYATGGSPESVTPDCGAVAVRGDVTALPAAIESLLAEKIPAESCTERAAEFDGRRAYEKYIELYEA